MDAVLNIAAGVATTNGYINSNSVSGHKTNFRKFIKNVNCVKTVNKSSQQESIDISFENISYSVSLGFRKGRKEILHDINGRFPSGQLIAIMGSSGAGKTTLLDILSGYRISGIRGTLYTNASVRDLNSFKKLSCYITHDNTLEPLLTVWENMKVAADLKLGLHVPDKEKDVLIKEILDTFLLQKSLNTRTSCLSGGEQKRLSIALELIDNPLVMFLDEPTTGLDSSSCSQCVKLLQRLVRQGRTIVCTVHQLSASLIQLFDQVYVLGDGRCLYQGTAKNLVYFLDFVKLPCPLYHNPVDYVIELTSGESKREKITIMSEAINNGRNFQWTEDSKFLTQLKKLKETEKETTDPSVQKIQWRRASHYDQFKILLRRGFIKCKRDMKLTYMRLVVNILSALLYGTLYWQSGTHGGKVRNNYSLVFCVLIHHLMSTLMLTILTFPNEMSILSKEYFNRWYSLKMYFASVTVSDIPILVLCCVSFTAIVYPMSGQPFELQRVAMFTTISILIVLTVQSSGLIVGSIFNVVNGTFMGFSLSILMMMLAGFGETLKDLPLNLYWVSYTSYMKYGFEGLLDSLYGLNRVPLYCPEDQYCHYKYPKKFLKDVMIQGDQFWTDVLGLCVIFLVLRILAFFVLKWKLLNSR